MMLTVTLSACSMFPQKFDNHEYAALANFVVDVEYTKETCKGDGTDTKHMLRMLDLDVRKLEVYTRYIPKNSEIHNVVKILRDDISEFKKRYDTKGHSKAYCETKADLIHKKALRILEAAAKKPR